MGSCTSVDQTNKFIVKEKIPLLSNIEEKNMKNTMIDKVGYKMGYKMDEIDNKNDTTDKKIDIYNSDNILLKKILKASVENIDENDIIVELSFDTFDFDKAFDWKLGFKPTIKWFDNTIIKGFRYISFNYNEDYQIQLSSCLDKLYGNYYYFPTSLNIIIKDRTLKSHEVFVPFSFCYKESAEYYLGVEINDTKISGFFFQKEYTENSKKIKKIVQKDVTLCFDKFVEEVEKYIKWHIKI